MKKESVETKKMKQERFTEMAMEYGISIKNFLGLNLTESVESLVMEHIKDEPKKTAKEILYDLIELDIYLCVENKEKFISKTQMGQKDDKKLHLLLHNTQVIVDFGTRKNFVLEEYDLVSIESEDEIGDYIEENEEGLFPFFPEYKIKKIFDEKRAKNDLLNQVYKEKEKLYTAKHKGLDVLYREFIKEIKRIKSKRGVSIEQKELAGKN